jgi:uncharacterized Zn-finger protein
MVEERYLVDDREVVVTTDMHVRCDGGNGALGHPIEYITLEPTGTARCKYCDRRFVHTTNPDAAVVRARGARAG